MSSLKHWFLAPSHEDPRYVSGGLQVFQRMFELVAASRPAEVVTYRRRDREVRFLDDVQKELMDGLVWVTWQPHVAELAERIPSEARVVLFAQAMDFGPRHGQDAPARWPFVCVSRFIAADYSVRQPWRLILHLPPVLHPGATNTGQARDIDVLVHRRKAVPYLTDRLVPALRKAGLRVDLVDALLPQEEFLARLNRSKTYLYWAHKVIANLELFEGFGLQPLEAIACGATPVSNVYGGMSDYLEAPHNCRKIGVHSLAYDVEQIGRAVEEHDGHNPDEDRLRRHYGSEPFETRFAAIEHELEFYFSHCPAGPPEQFELEPPPRPLIERAQNKLYGALMRQYRAARGIRPT